MCEQFQINLVSVYELCNLIGFSMPLSVKEFKYFRIIRCINLHC
jgi:hypothetical protein